MHSGQTPATVALQPTGHTEALGWGEDSMGYELTGKKWGGAATRSSEVQINGTQPES